MNKQLIGRRTKNMSGLDKEGFFESWGPRGDHCEGPTVPSLSLSLSLPVTLFTQLLSAVSSKRLLFLCDTARVGNVTPTAGDRRSSRAHVGGSWPMLGALGPCWGLLAHTGLGVSAHSYFMLHWFHPAGTRTDSCIQGCSAILCARP